MNPTVTKIKENIAKVIIGKQDTVELLLTSLIAGGHVLLEDVPGRAGIYQSVIGG